MSAHDMHPTFHDRAGYRAWRAQWRSIQAQHTKAVRELKATVKDSQRRHPGGGVTAAQQKELAARRVMGAKIMTLLETAKLRWKRILSMEQQMADQMARFPLTLENCPTIDFHFNKGSLEFPQLPAWTLKAKGQSYYVRSVKCEAMFETVEKDSGSTRGLLRIRRANLYIDGTGAASLTSARTANKIPRAA